MLNNKKKNNEKLLTSINHKCHHVRISQELLEFLEKFSPNTLSNKKLLACIKFLINFQSKRFEIIARETNDSFQIDR